MSRRKQAKPRPIFAYEDEPNTGQSDELLIPLTQTNGHRLADRLDDQQDEQGEFEEFAPLVMDTSSHDIPPSGFPDARQSTSPLSIKTTSGLPVHSQAIRPTPVKPYKPPADLSTNSYCKDMVCETSAPSNLSRVSSATSLSSMTSFTSNTIKSENIASTSITSLPSGPETPARETTSPSPSSSPSVVRRGSKTSDENDENLDYDSDFDDLEELLSELIRDKILPIAGEDGEKFICPVCNCSLLNLHDLTVHIRSHNTQASGNQSNECKICGKILSSQSSLDRHMLVHSGERPFICKICNMSFTTNGNMHRHSRIHTKEESLNAMGSKFQMRRGKSAWRQRINSYINQGNSPVSDRMKTMPTLQAEILQTLPNHSQQSVFGRPNETMSQIVPGMKRQLSYSDVPAEWHTPYKRQTLETNSDNRPQLSPKKYSYHFPAGNVEAPADAKSDQEREEAVEKHDEGDKEVLHCPVCPKTFLCKYGLETHLETHPDYSTHCQICNMTFKNSRKLSLHHLIAHTEVNKEGEKDGKESSSQELKVGFQDLSFVDFSVEKFALIAKRFFEKNTRMSSSAYLNFTCKVCAKAFPCESSLLLHSYTHSKQNSTVCPLCDSDYGDVNGFHTHMLKHLSDKAFEDIRPSLSQEKGDEDVKPTRLSKPDFLAMFELKEDEENTDKPQSTPVSKDTPKSSKLERDVNNKYFAKLGQVFASGVPPLFAQFPMFPPGYQPTLDDFHKMLQIATNMNALPSMGPGLLMKGLPAHGSAMPSPSKHPSGIQQASVPRSASASPVPAHSKSPMKSKPSPEEPRPLLSGPEREINNIKMMNSGSFPCKYCDNVFSSYKTLKVHIRSHLGLTSYQCNLCVYSSGDKSSLIRHIRTHTGDRPFQCTICDFAFTIRANCERHIRKKHSIIERDDIDRYIFHNKFSDESIASDISFHSPDTICKYCGIDFKYFRALKDHLCSKSSGSQKPYKCDICDMAFCTRGNCVRHIKKVHTGVSDNQIEKCIKVYEAMSCDSEDVDPILEDGIPLYTEESQQGTARSDMGTPQPPAAHSTPKPESLSGRNSRHVSPNRHISPLSHISPTRSPLVNTEVMNTEENSPLDFSMKSSSETAKDQNQGGKSGKAGDAPIDLTVKKNQPYTPIYPKLPTLPPMEPNLFPCPACPVGYSTLSSLDIHIRKQHPSVSEATTLPHAFSAYSMVNNDGKLLLPPKSLTSSLPVNRSKAIHQPRPIKPKISSGSMMHNLQEKIKQNLKRENVARSPSGMDSDLSSVTKMLDATDAHNFQAFFNSEHRYNSVPSEKKTSPHMPNILRRPGVQISLEHCKAINRELDNLEREGDVDEVALSQVREMALSVKEECVNSTPATPSTATTVTAPKSVTHSPVPSQQEMQEDENSGDGSVIIASKEADRSTGENNPIKKKRNSYADSPHKLSCPYCPRAFPWVSSLTRHLLTHTGQKPFKCPRCPVTFSTKSNRERHLIRKHGVNMLDPLSRQTMDRPYKCPLCVFSSFSTQSNLLKHYRDRHNGMNLPDNIADIERMSPSAIKAATLEMESRAAENPPQMDEDSSMMTMTTEEDEEDLDNSMDSSEKNFEDEMDPAEDKADSVSEHSEKSSYSLPALSEQGPLVIAEPEKEKIDTPKIAPHLMLTMPELHRMKPESSEMELAHERQAEELRKTESPATISKNIQRIIAEQKAIIEKQAKMEMKMQAEIRAHIETQRKTDEIPHISPVPVDSENDQTKRFTGSAERIINPERDNYDVDKITECWKCKDVFPSRKVLVRHLKEHNIDLPYKCYLCDASYDKRVDCLIHQEDSHSSDWTILKEKNKVGDIDQFATHMDKVVENNCNKLDSGSILEIPGSGNDDSKMEVISADYMQRKVYCSLCPKRFWSLQDLRRHMRSHTGERPFECDICQKRFTLKHSMMRHRKKHVGAPPRSFEEDDDSNGLDDKGAKSARHVPSRNMPAYPFFTLGSDPMSLGNTFLFSPGLSGGRLTIGGSNIGSLIPSSVAATATSTVTSTVPHTEVKQSTAENSQVDAVKKVTGKPDRATLDSVKKEFLDCDADMLHNLLGVESAAIEKMLDSADSQTAAKFLGVTEVS